MPYCAACGHSNPDEAKFCTGCGAGLSSNPGSPAVVDGALPVAVAAPEPRTNRRRGTWIALAVAAVLLLAGAAYGVWYYNENIKPMDVDEYEETVADLWEKIEEGVENLDMSAEDNSYIANLADDQVIEEGPYNEMIAPAQERIKDHQELLVELRDLRAPTEYEDEQETFSEYSNLMLTVTDGILSIVAEAPGHTLESWDEYGAEQLESLIGDTMGDEEDMSRLNDEVREALEEVTGETFGY